MCNFVVTFSLLPFCGNLKLCSNLRPARFPRGFWTGTLGKLGNRDREIIWNTYNPMCFLRIWRCGTPIRCPDSRNSSCITSGCTLWRTGCSKPLSRKSTSCVPEVRSRWDWGEIELRLMWGWGEIEVRLGEIMEMRLGWDWVRLTWYWGDIGYRKRWIHILLLFAKCRTNYKTTNLCLATCRTHANLNKFVSCRTTLSDN